MFIIIVIIIITITINSIFIIIIIIPIIIIIIIISITIFLWYIWYPGMDGWSMPPFSSQCRQRRYSLEIRSALLGIYHQDPKARLTTLGVSSKCIAQRTIQYVKTVYGEKLLIFIVLLWVFFF